MKRRSPEDRSGAPVQLPRVNGEPAVCLTRNGDVYTEVGLDANYRSESNTILKYYQSPGEAKFDCQGRDDLENKRCVGTTTYITLTAQNIEYVGHQIVDYTEVKTLFPACSDTTNLSGDTCYTVTIYEDDTLVELVAVDGYSTKLQAIGYTRSASAGYHVSVDNNEQQYLFTQRFDIGTYEIPILGPFDGDAWKKHLVVRFPELSCSDINEYLVRVEAKRSHFDYYVAGTSPTRAWEQWQAVSIPGQDPEFTYYAGTTVLFHKTFRVNSGDDFLLCAAGEGINCVSDSSLVELSITDATLNAASVTHPYTFSAQGTYDAVSVGGNLRRFKFQVQSGPPSPPVTPYPPPSLPNHILELSGCSDTTTEYEVLVDLRVTVSNTSLTNDQVVARTRDAIHSNIVANTGVSVPLHNIVVSTEVQTGIMRPPTPPRPPSMPP